MGEGECEIPKETTKKSRHRKKHLYSKILNQMEFYFSDSNLSKDRFLSQLLAQSPYVDIDVFLRFNKIKKLNCTVDDICKAISKSELIEVSEDGKKIHRKKPLKIKENVDDCTIYIENIKSDADHEWLSQIFSDFGNVVYVSIPKYKHNKLNKGFAFIEFENEKDAKNALEFFESIGCKMPSDIDPEDLKSIATFEGAEEKEKKSAKNDKSKKRTLSEESDDNTCNKVKVEKTDHKPAKNTGKYKAGDECSKHQIEEDITSKKIKLSVENGDNIEKKVKAEGTDSIETQQNDSKEGKKKKNKNNKKTNMKELKESEKNDKDEKSVDNDKSKKRTLDEENEDTTQKKVKLEKTDEKIAKNTEDECKAGGECSKHEIEEDITSKKRKLSVENVDNIEKKVKMEETDSTETEENDSKDGKKKKNKKDKRRNMMKELGLQLLSKKEWKRMRNRYLDLQKKKMKEFKQYLNRQRFSKHSRLEKAKEEKEVVNEKNAEAAESVEANKLDYTPGVIVKIKLAEPYPDAKKIKNELKLASQHVKYVDTPQPSGGEEVFLRFDSANYAKEFCKQDFPGEKIVLENDEEQMYWDKIKNDRNIKLSKANKKQRGRDKLLKKAEKERSKHLRFDENDN